MIKIKFYSPSYKRSGNIDVTKWLAQVILCVHEFEEKEYRNFHDNELMILPDSLKGQYGKGKKFHSGAFRL